MKRLIIAGLLIAITTNANAMDQDAVMQVNKLIGENLIEAQLYRNSIKAQMAELRANNVTDESAYEALEAKCIEHLTPITREGKALERQLHTLLQD